VLARNAVLLLPRSRDELATWEYLLVDSAGHQKGDCGVFFRAGFAAPSRRFIAATSGGARGRGAEMTAEHEKGAGSRAELAG
jgi:hypothetical protein